MSEALCIAILRVLERLKINAAMGVTTQEVGPSEWSIIVPEQGVLNLTAIVEGVRELGVTVHMRGGTLLFAPPESDLPEGVEQDETEVWPEGTSCRKMTGEPCPTMPCERCGNGLSFVDATSFEFGVTTEAQAPFGPHAGGVDFGR